MNTKEYFLERRIIIQHRDNDRLYAARLSNTKDGILYIKSVSLTYAQIVKGLGMRHTQDLYTYINNYLYGSTKTTTVEVSSDYIDQWLIKFSILDYSILEIPRNNNIQDNRLDYYLKYIYRQSVKFMLNHHSEDIYINKPVPSTEQVLEICLPNIIKNAKSKKDIIDTIRNIHYEFHYDYVEVTEILDFQIYGEEINFSYLNHSIYYKDIVEKLTQKNTTLNNIINKYNNSIILEGGTKEGTGLDLINYLLVTNKIKLDTTDYNIYLHYVNDMINNL